MRDSREAGGKIGGTSSPLTLTKFRFPNVTLAHNDLSS
jgi:hypothetical protein